MVRLAGNTRHEAKAQNDLGRVESDLHLDMYLQLKRSPDQERAAKEFVESLTDKSSPNFHKWITAAEYGRRFGASAEDIETVSRWLESRGFVVNGVPTNNMVIDFSGAAAQVSAALHTEIHYVNARGKRYFANMSDPQIPAALLPAVTGVVSLSNIQPYPMYKPKSDYTVSSTRIPIVPGDLATIYNLNPAFAAGYTGRGQTIAVIEDTNLYNGTSDWSVFRKAFGLDQFTHGSLTQVHPAPGKGSTCRDPGINGAEVEAALDVEWVSAAAPDAAIVMASCGDTTTFGGFIALQNLLTNGGPLPSVATISYGEPEIDAGAAQNAFINTLYQTAAAAGVSVFVSSGDEAAAEDDFRSQVAIHGITVSAFASTPYNVAVGGTDFGDVASHTTTAFWNANNGVHYDSAKGYVAEIPWNESCAGQVLNKYLGFSSPFGPSNYCNSTYNGLIAVGGSGGPSACVTGSPALDEVVGGSCAGYPKPSWQSIAGNPADGVRDIPDVSLFAASGLWGHYYVFCLFSDTGGCDGDPSNWFFSGGGTSFASPIMAGIQAVINQALGTANVGNPNPVYYEIGQAEYNSTAGAAACDSSVGPASTCSFNDVTQGDIVVPCAGIFNCFFGGGGLGVLSTSNTSYAPAYAATPGWDFATGIGTVNAWNLLSAYVNSISPLIPPPAPQLLSPADKSTDVLPAPVLTWDTARTTTTYNVYFGKVSPPPLVTNTLSLNYAPGTLAPSTTYYWAIGAKNSVGETVSTAFSFTTSCVAALSPAATTFSGDGGTGTIPITAAAGCAWTASSQVPWITISSGASGNGNGTIAYTVAANSGAARSGTITVAGQVFTITQGGQMVMVISTLAGGAMPATASPGTSLSIPVSYGIAVDSSGNGYFISANFNVVFKVDAAGVVTRFAGTGVAGYSGDSGPALNAQLYSPYGVAVDGNGNVYRRHW
jgi:subtilase family serine protease